MSRLGKFVRSAGLLWGFILTVIILSFVSPRFLSVMNVGNITQRMAFIGIVACGLAFVIIIGGIDLSVGSMQALGGFILAKLYVTFGFPLIWGVILTILISLAIGIVTGTLVSKAKIPAFIITLGFMQIYRSVTEILNEAQPIIGLPEYLTWWVTPLVFKTLPPVAILWIIIVFVFFFMEKKLKLGRYMFVIGGNEEVGKLSGINVDFYKTIPYVMTAVLACISGMLLATKLYGGLPEMGTGFELQVISAICIGGVSLYGGKGSIMQVTLGVIFLVVIDNALVLLGLHEYGRQIFTGLFVVIAIVVSNIGMPKRILPV